MVSSPSLSVVVRPGGPGLPRRLTWAAFRRQSVSAYAESPRREIRSATGWVGGPAVPAPAAQPALGSAQFAGCTWQINYHRPTTSSLSKVTCWLGRGPRPDEFIKFFVKPFNAAQNRVHLDLTVVEKPAQERTVRALEAGTGPDSVMIPRAGDHLDLVKRGHLLDLSPYADRYGWRSRLLAPATRLTTVDGKLFGVPRSSETMGLMFNTSALAALGVQPPRTLRDLEDVADRALGSGVLPFGAGSAAMPSVCELIWTLVVNHHAGPAAVRGALRGDLPWTSQVFVHAVEHLRSWFDRSWFGTTYFEETITQGLSRVANGEAAMAPMMTGMLPEDCPKVGVVPFPLLRQETAQGHCMIGICLGASRETEGS
ncbi:ABC transporter substrate-binding protein [Streptomyces sp. NPDC006285]|uniref:ABC transporter substrate-binding protein n=1 Tax=Streptomyces sp. NPDC006285 TaxID=3364742 RepID=UPI00369981B1